MLRSIASLKANAAADSTTKRGGRSSLAGSRRTPDFISLLTPARSGIGPALPLAIALLFLSAALGLAACRPQTNYPRAVVAAVSAADKRTPAQRAIDEDVKAQLSRDKRFQKLLESIRTK